MASDSTIIDNVTGSCGWCLFLRQHNRCMLLWQTNKLYVLLLIVSHYVTNHWTIRNRITLRQTSSYVLIKCSQILEFELIHRMYVIVHMYNSAFLYNYITVLYFIVPMTCLEIWSCSYTKQKATIQETPTYRSNPMLSCRTVGKSVNYLTPVQPAVWMSTCL